MSVPDLLIVDGSNLARSSAWRAANAGLHDDELHARLVHRVLDHAARAQQDVVVVFDGPGPEAVPHGLHALVMHSGRRDADSVIRDQVSSAIAAGRATCVVTDDRELIETVAARSQSTGAFVRAMRHGASEDARDLSDRHHQVEGSEDSSVRRGISFHLSADVNDALERMRRGESE